MNIAATIVSMGGPEGLGVVCSPAGCLQVAVVVRTALLAVSGLLGVLATLSYLSDARRAYQEERHRVRAEATALESFANRVRGLTPDAPTASGPGPTTTLTAPSSTGAQQIRAAYRETLMSVEHYEEDYGEPLAENMQSELGPEVTSAVTGGSPLSPGLQQATVAAAEGCVKEREAFLNDLATELGSLSDAAGPLQSIESALDEIKQEPRIDGFDALSDRWERLDRLERACTEVVDDRRACLAERDAFDLAGYLYSSVGPPYPVVATAAALVADIHQERRKTCDMLTRVV